MGRINGAEQVFAKRDTLYLFLKGMAMGAAEVVPGVSGGTIAFITGIYERLLNAVRSLTPGGLLVLKKRGVVACWRHIDGSFLLVLFLGMAVSILSVAQVVNVLLHEYPVGLWSFFFGLIVASCLIIGVQIESWKAGSFGFVLVGGIVGLIISNAIPVELEATPMYLFAGGAMAVFLG